MAEVLEVVLGGYLAMVLMAGIFGFFTKSTQCLICYERYSIAGFLVNAGMCAIVPHLYIQASWEYLRYVYRNR